MGSAKKDAAAKVMDIKPGKHAPSASGRPVIVSNGPALAADPMMVDHAVRPDPVLASHTAKAVKPIPESAAPEHTAATAPAASEPTDSAAEAGDAQIHIELPSRRGKLIQAPSQSLPHASPAGAEAPSGAPLASVAGEHTPADPVAAAAPAESGEASVSHGGSTKVNIAPLSGLAAPRQNAVPEEAAGGSDETEVEGDVEGQNKAAERAAADACSAREAELEQIAASGKYVLPIRPAKQGMSFFKGVLIAVLIVILAAVIVDGLLDAGLISIGNLKAPTNFFDAGSSAHRQ